MEQYAVKITEPARRQLQEIIRYIAEDLQEKRTAIRMLDTLEKELLSFSRLPNQVALTEEEPWHSAGIRKIPVKNYLVYFWVNEERKKVQITAVVYGRRDQRTALQNMKYESTYARVGQCHRKLTDSLYGVVQQGYFSMRADMAYPVLPFRFSNSCSALRSGVISSFSSSLHLISTAT